MPQKSHIVIGVTAALIVFVGYKWYGDNTPEVSDVKEEAPCSSMCAPVEEPYIPQPLPVISEEEEYEHSRGHYNGLPARAVDFANPKKEE